MGQTSERRGRKIRREGGHRTPACKACQQRKVKCSGGSPCSACCRKAAWDGVPPPEFCEYDGGFIPARKPAPPSTSRQPANSAGALESLDDKGKGKASKPLQKGLACLACKSRRVRCDGSKPACSSCLRTAKRENRDPCCVYRADLHLAQQQLLERCSGFSPDTTSNRDQESISPDEADEDPHTSPRSCSSRSASPAPPPRLDYDYDVDLKIPESALPPLPEVFAAPSPVPSSVFAPFPVPSRSSSSATLSYPHTHSYPPSPSLTHTSTDPSSSYPSPATPFSSVEEFIPPPNLYNYPPLPYPPAESEGPSSMWAVPPLALGASVSNAPFPPTCESVEFQCATHDLDLTLTLPMSPPPSFNCSTSALPPAPFLATPVKVEPPTPTGERWWAHS